jgi:hypothetical protein
MRITHRAARSIAGLAIAGTALFGFVGEASAVPSSDCGVSHHSDTGNGANRSGPYDSSCDGSASQNGVGAGNATGRPCAGCVGNADDKNPPGQMPDGTDRNAGYECDTNQGVGQTNPAHSGCEPGGGGGHG